MVAEGIHSDFLQGAKRLRKKTMCRIALVVGWQCRWLRKARRGTALENKTAPARLNGRLLSL